MLRDITEVLRRPAPWHLAPMGYFRELSGIARRADECRESWQPHLMSTQAIIERAVSSCRDLDTVVVAGSGLLLDVPVDTLNRSFRRVVLADIHHGRQTRKAVRGLSNVELVSVDITGVVRACYRFARSGCRGPLPESRPGINADGPFDLAVSVNLLSQLAVIPRQYIQAHCPAFPPVRMEEFGRELVLKHLDWLAGNARRACLVSDVERHEEGPDGQTVVKDLLDGVHLPEPEETWMWNIAPRGKVFSEFAVAHRVAAWSNFTWTSNCPSGSR